jgi:hypothetical protein
MIAHQQRRAIILVMHMIFLSIVKKSLKFLEIELLKFKKDDNVTKRLDNLKVEYFDNADDLIIQGYSVSVQTGIEPLLVL